MWETIRAVLLSPNATIVMAFLLILVVIISVLSRRGILSINTKGLSLGADVQERDIIRQQCEWTHNYIMGLYSKIQPMTDNKYEGYYTRYMLEIAYSEIVDWITFNHMKLDSEYIEVKQLAMRTLIYTHPIDSQFRTKSFERQIDQWVDEIIRKLVRIREVYNK